MSALPVEMLGGRFHFIKRNLPGVLLISALVGAAFAFSNWQSAVSPLALSVAFGFLVANLWKWPEWAKAGSAFAGKRLLRSGVVLLGFQVSLSALKVIGIKAWSLLTPTMRLCSESAGWKSMVGPTFTIP